MPRLAVLVGRYPPAERRRREAMLQRYAGAALEIVPVEVPADPYLRQITAEFPAAAAPIYLDVMRQVEADGFDAVMPLGSLDLGVEVGRSHLRIPVIGPLEACMAEAARIAPRFGLLTYTSSIIPYMLSLAERYGWAERVAGVRALEIDLPDMVERLDLLRERALTVGRELVADGAGAIVVIGTTTCPLWLSPDDLGAELGVPVLDGVSVPIRLFRSGGGTPATLAPPDD